MINKTDIKRIVDQITAMMGNYDSDFPNTGALYGNICFCDKTTGEVLCIRDDYKKPDLDLLDWEIPDIQRIRENPDQFIVIPVLDHGDWHTIFVQWLESIGKFELYASSIGLTLKILAGYNENNFNQDEYYKWRNKWSNYQHEYFQSHITKFLEDNLVIGD